MIKFLKKFRKFTLLSELLFFFPVLFSGILLKLFRLFGARNLPYSRNILRKIGIFPIINHYYEPWFNGYKDLKNFNKSLPFSLEQQLSLLSQLDFSSEFRSLVRGELQNVDYSYAMKNGSFESGDAELLYAMVRRLQPKTVVEIGCGNSTKLINAALLQNETNHKNIQHFCIEPYEQPWLDSFKNVTLIRKPIESCDINLNEVLSSGDLLFIDSSHIIRPGGDVHYIYLNILPKLVKGVIIHIHDIFTPQNYLAEWLDEDVKFWNEQFLLECILANSDRYEVLFSANFVKNQAFNKFKKISPYLEQSREPGSIYLKIK